ncbi:hypothetical protein [Rufibacter radiotolerans]|uniref:hypothetical protein n=1 Tax=Rufibacter radiotolerans TaxID=1379910 RepID=UPI0012E18E3C|nr:hypothetical protein [Rufibacter radiotolerans]
MAKMYDKCSAIYYLGFGVFYSTQMDDGGINVSDCSISKVLPPLSQGLVLPPPSGYKGDINKYYLHNGFNQAEESFLLTTNWTIEYALLNAYRNNHREEVKTQINNKDYISYIALALSILAVFIAFFRKRP